MGSFSPMKALRIAAIAAASLFVLTTCDDLFKAGLGDKVDIDPPIVTIVTPTNGQYVGGTVTFAGTYGDDSEVAALQLSLDGGKTFSSIKFDPKATEWEYAVNTAAIADGEKDIRVRIEDGAGKSADKKLLVYFDNRAPIVLIKDPQGYASEQYNDDISIRGEATDSSGIVRVEIEPFDEAGEPVALFDSEGNPTTSYSVDVDGTNSWSFLFQSRFYTDAGATLVGIYEFVITATDKAGISNSYTYHYDDILALAGTTVTVENLYRIEHGESVSGHAFNAADLTPLRLDGLVLDIDQSLDIPQFEFSTPSVDNNSLGENAVAVGTVIDDDGVDTGTIEVRIDSTDEADWEAVTTVKGSGLSVSWEYDLAALAEGSHTIQVRASDIYGVSNESTTLAFVIDSGVPTISIAAPDSGDYISATFQLTGTTGDSVGIDLVEISTNNGPYENVTTFDSGVFTEVDGFKTYDWSHDFTVETDGSTDGSYTFRVRTTDLSGKSASDSIQVYVDTVLPTITFLSPVDGASVNGTIRIQGTTQNTSPLTSITLEVEDSASTTETYVIDDVTNEFDTGPTGNPSTMYGWYKDIDTTGFDDGALTVTLTADDAASKINSEILNLTVDQSTDLPQIIFDNMDVNGTATDNAFAGSPSLIGRVIDDDGVDMGSIQVRIDSSDEADWAAVGITTGGGLSASWEQSIAALSEGSHTIEVKAQDINGIDSFSAIYGVDIPEVPFILDLGAPEVEVTSITDLSGSLTAPFQGKYVDGDFTISGTADDGIGVASVQYSLNGGASQNLTLTPVSGNEVSWNFTIDISAEGLADGVVNIQVESADFSGKTAFSDIQLILDTIVPTVEILLPTDASTVNSLVEIKGTASDANQVSAVYLWTDAATSTAPGDAAAGDFTGWISPTGIYSWTYNFNSRGNNGAWQAQIAAVDAAGNISAIETRLFALDQSTDKPVVSYTNVTAGAPAATNLLTSADTISGTITDDDGVDPATVMFSTDGLAWLDEAETEFNVTGTGQTVSFTYELTAAAAGESQIPYELYVRASDTDPDALGAIASDEELVDFAVDDANPTVTLETYSAGLVNVTGGANIPGSYFSTTDGFLLTVSTSDAVGVTGVDVTVNGQTNAATDLTGGDYDFDTDDFVNLLTVPPMAEGQTIVRVTVTDFFGKTTSQDVQLFVDDTSPAVAYIQPTAGTAANGEFVIQGTGSDNKKLSKLDLTVGALGAVPVTYTIDTEAALNQLDPGSTVYRWDKTIDTELITGANYGARPTADYGPTDLAALQALVGMSTGEYAELVDTGDWYLYNSAEWIPADPWEIRLSVIGTDAAGNESTPGAVNFITDQAADIPVVRLTNRSLNATAGLYVFTGDTVEGTVTDDDGVDTASLEISFDSGSTWIDPADATHGSKWTVTGSGTNVSFSFDISTLLGEGDDTVIVRASDLAASKAGGYPAVTRTTTEYAFTIDRNAPTITVEHLISGGIDITTNFQGNYFRGDITLTGITDDGPKDALTSVGVDYTFTPGVWDGYEPVLGTLTNWNFTTAFGGADGPVDIRIQAVDEFGKTTVYELEEVIDIIDPVVAFLTPSAGEDDVNSLVTFTGTASDANQVTDVYIWTGATGAADPNDPTGGVFTDWTGPLPDTYSWSYDYDSRGNNGTWRARAFAIDIAGNISTPVERLFTLDQSADKPVVSYTNVTAGAPAATNLLTSTDIISGTITDDDAVDPATVMFSTDGSNWFAEIPGTFDVTGTGQTVSFTYDLGIAVTPQSQTPYEFYVRASDTDPDALGAIASDEELVDYAVDDSDPTMAYATYVAGSRINIATPSSIPGSYFDDEFVLTGTANDGVGIVSVTVTIDGDTNAATLGGTDTAATWSFNTADFDPNPDLSSLTGETIATITVEDFFGKTIARELQLFGDHTEPTVAIDDPVASDALITTLYSIIGTADDGTGSGIHTVYWWIEDPAVTPAGDPPADMTTWNTATGTSSWNKNIDLSTYAPEGEWRLHVGAADATDILTSAAETVDFFIDLTDPTISYDVNPPDGSVFMEDFTITGIAGDANTIAATDVEVSINSGAYAQVTSGTTAWSNDIDITNLNAGSNSITVRVTDIGGHAATTTRTFYRDQDAPTFDFNNLDVLGGTTVFQESTPKIVGTTNDATGVASFDTYIESYDYGTATWSDEETWTALGAPAGATVYNWQKDLGPTGLNLAEGRYRITVRAADAAQGTANSANSSTVIFRLDRTNPALALTAPAQGSYQDGDFAVTGTSSDLNTIASVSVRIDAGAETPAVSTTGTTFATWEVAALDTTGLSQGAHTLYITATDGTGRTTVLTRDFTFDTVDPTINIIDPLSGTAVNGAVTVKGTTNDTNAVSLVELKIGLDTIWNALGGVYNWEYDFTNIDTYANASYATDQGGGVWRLYVHIRATDAAGNVGEENSYYLDLDPSLDTPITTIYQPLDNSTLGGSVRVYGIATDDDAVHHIEMSIDLNNDGLYDGAGNEDYWDWDGSTGSPTMGADGDTNDWFEQEDVWYEINGTTNWFQVINAYGEYNSPVPGVQRTIKARVRAVDTKDGLNPGVAGNPVEITITFDNTVPIIEDIEIDLDATNDGINETPYTTGLRVSGTYYLRATIKDESDIMQIDRIEEGPLSGTTSYSSPWPGEVTYEGPSGGYEVYTLQLEIDTTTLGGGVFVDTSGQYAMSIKATDDASPNPFVTYSYINVQIDNFYPSGTYDGILNPVVGTDYKISGEATDVGAGSGTIQGIDKITAYFVRGTDVYDPLTGATADWATVSDSVTVKNEDNGGAIEAVDIPNDGAGTAYRIYIDSLEELGGAGTSDGDGHTESLTISGNDYIWWAEVDTFQLTDGPIDLHYVVYDDAGNATHYVQQLFVRNNGPVIDSIDLATDLNGDGDVVDASESTNFTTGYAATDFTSRNDLLKIGINTSGGNGDLFYSVIYDGTERFYNIATDLSASRLYRIRTVGSTDFTLIGSGDNNVGTYFEASGAGIGDGTASLVSATIVADGSLQIGNDYYIRTVGTSTFTTVGAASNTIGTIFTATGADSGGNGDVFQIDAYPENGEAIIVDFVPGDDSGTPIPPANDKDFDVRVYDSTPGTTPGVDSLEATETISLTIDNIDGTPPTINVNALEYEDVVMDGLTALGHLELASTYNGGDDDVSGIINYTGDADDNQRIEFIKVTIPGFDPDGGGGAAAGDEFTVASWNGSGLTGLSQASGDGAPYDYLWTFSIDTETVAESGHDITWTFEWDSARLGNVVGNNVALSFKAEDFTPNDDTASLTVDVVPYISEIETELGQTSPLNPSVLNRTALGRYPVWKIEAGASDTYETIIVHGFNLRPDEVTLGSETEGDTNDGVNAAFNGLAAGVDTLTPIEQTATREYTVSINGASQSGPLNFIANVGGVYIPTWNNTNSNGIDTNKEPNGVNNDLLDDDRWIEFWEVTQTDPGGDIRMVDMEIYNNNVNWSYGYADNQYQVMENGTGRSLRQAYTRYFDNKVAFNTDGNYAGVAQAGDTYLVPVTLWSYPSFFAFSYQPAGAAAPGDIWEYNNAANDRRLKLESNWNGSDLNKNDRAQLPDMKLRGDDAYTEVYLVYYDSIQKLTKFRYFEVGDAANITGTADVDYYALDGTYRSTAIPYTAGGGVNNNDTIQALGPASSWGGSGRQGFTAIAGSGENSTSHAVAFADDGTAIVAWYDSNTNSLKMKYNTSPGTSYSGYQEFTRTTDPPAGTYTFKLAVDGAAVNGGNDISVTFDSANNNEIWELAYQLNKVISESYGAYAEVSPTTGRVIVRSFDTGPSSSISITAPTAGSSLITAMTSVQAAVPGAGQPWVERTIDSGSAGKFVSIAVAPAPDTTVHLAYQNTSTGDLKYAQLADYDGAITTVTVDSYLQVGQYTDIAVRMEGGNPNPYISYYNLSEADTKRASKMARMVDPSAAPTDGVSLDKFTQSWEVTILPSRNPVEQYRVSVGITTGMGIIVGYKGDADLERIQYIP